jgi:hypothetical protein
MRPIACTLSSGQMRKRRRRWDELARRAFVARVLSDRGLRLEFRRDAGVEEELRDLALLEGACCAFADWDVTASDRHVELNVSASSVEGVAAVQAMFNKLASRRQR